MDLVAEGRDCQMFDAGPGRLLRRARDGRSIEAEARIIRYVGEQGFPVPEIYDVRAGGTEIVMERVDGPHMADAIVRRPWTTRAHARTLADLHDRLHEIAAPQWPEFRAMGGGDRLLHLDLHPLNVIMAPRGPVVIDWTNAAAGEPLLDCALTYVLMTCPRMPGPRWLGTVVRPLRGPLAREFARRYRGRAFDEQLAIAGELKALDTNLYPDEIAACLKVSERARSRLARSAGRDDGSPRSRHPVPSSKAGAVSPPPQAGKLGGLRPSGQRRP